jgi:predicted transcriptional regulator
MNTINKYLNEQTKNTKEISKIYDEYMEKEKKIFFETLKKFETLSKKVEDIDDLDELYQAVDAFTDDRNYDTRVKKLKQYILDKME